MENEQSQSIFIDYFKFREMDKSPDYPEIYRNMKSPKVDMGKMFQEYFEFREFEGYRKPQIY
jgi:hypothetical protein